MLSMFMLNVEVLDEERQDAAEKDYHGTPQASAVVDVPHRVLRKSKRLRGQAAER